MHTRGFYVALTGSLLSSAIAAPTPTQDEVEIERRQVIGNIISSGLRDILDTVNDITNGNADTDDPFDDLLDTLKPISPVRGPTSPQEASAAISNVFQASPTPENLIEAAAQLAAQGLTSDNILNALAFVDGALTGQNSDNNNNPRNPNPAAFPTAGPTDAPYSLSEDDLRKVIHIPDSFRYGADGAPQPIILVPGTGNTGYITFAGNYIPLLQGSDIADPVWLNIPGYLLGDAQTHAEYVAYAINYIYGISNKRPVAVAAWSQGNIDAQWAYKYWPSTRDRVTDHIGFSADYAGTVLANVIDLPGVPLPPSVLQQRAESNFINKLRSNDGDSSYVPSTLIYSGFFDEVVQPQSGNAASGRLRDTRGVGASNNEVQVICKGQLGGSFYTHEGTLYNPLGFALLKDALANNGTGLPSRLDLGSVCNDFIAPELAISDFLLTENAVLIAALAILAYPQKVFDEPAIRSYAA